MPIAESSEHRVSTVQNEILGGAMYSSAMKLGFKSRD
jgi:hypothetical protein